MGPAAYLSVLIEANTGTAQANMAKFNAELDATKANSMAATGSVGKFTSGLSKVGRIAKYGAAAGVAAFLVVANKAVDTTQELSKAQTALHLNFGLSVKQAGRWASVAASRGIDNNKLGMTFRTLGKQVEAAAHGSTTAQKMFDKLGISTQYLKSHQKDVYDVMLKVSDGVKKLGPGFQATSIQASLFGRNWQTLAPLMRDGSKALQEQLTALDKYGGIQGPKALKVQQDLLAANRESKAAWMGLQVQLADKLAPTLIYLNKQFQHIAATMADPKLTNEQKFNKIARIIRRDFNAVFNWFVDHIPQIAKHAGQAGAKLAEGLVQGFLKSDALGKLVISLWLFKAFGGAGAIKAVGGKLLAMMFGTTAGAGALSTVASKANPVPVWVVNQLPGGGGPGGGVAGEAGGVGGYAKGAGMYKSPIGPENVVKPGMGFAEAATRSPLAVGGAIATGLLGFQAMGHQDVEQSVPNRYNAAAHAMDPTKVLHLVGLPALSDLLPAVQKLPPGRIMDFALSGRTGPIGPTTRGGHTASGVARSQQALLPGKPATSAANQIRLGQQLAFATNMVDPAQEAGKKIQRVIQDMIHNWGGLQHVAKTVSKDQAHNFLQIALEAKLPKREIAKLAMAFFHAGKLSKKDMRELSKTTGLSMKQIREAASHTQLTIHRTSQKSGRDIHEFGTAGHKSAKDIKQWGADVKATFDKVMHKNAALVGSSDDSSKKQGKNNQMTVKSITDWAAQTVNHVQQVMKHNKDLRDDSGKNKKKLSDDADQTQKNVVKSYGNLNKGVQQALGKLQDATNKALRAVGAQPVNFGIASSSSGGGGKQKKARGGIVDGIGSGDKINALLEPGEFVMNREAVKAYGAHNLARMNRKFGRFAKGGKVGTGTWGSNPGDFALGPYTVPPIQYDPDHAGSNSHVHISAVSIPWLINTGHKLQQMGNAVNEFAPTRFGNPFNFGPITTTRHAHYPTDHYSGHAVDVTSLKGAQDKSWVASIARVLSGGGVAGAIAEKIARVLLKGPIGAMLSTGQGSVDKVWRGAQALINRKSSMAGMDPGMGKSLFKGGGRFISTAYGPPWGGIQGTGVTATGIDLTRGQKAYIVAVDPSVIPLHSKLNISPNPFNYKGTFAAEDTGGAIQGNRIDFYDWLGRSHQYAWGMRPVNVKGAMKGGLVKSFGGGGIVEGPPGRPRQIVAHGGERVKRANERLRYQITITNWREGTGYMEEIADGSTNQGRRLHNQLDRMRR